MLHVCLLGGLTLAWDQTPLRTIRSKRARSLLAYLATYRDRPHTRDLLIGTFWPDLPETTARRRLSKALWRVRRILPEAQMPHAAPIIVAAGDTVQLNPHLPIWLDVEAFIRHHKQCTNGEAGAVAAGQQCLALYQGEFLAGYHDDWAVVERERLRELFLLTLAQLVEIYKSRGDYDQALYCARQLAEVDPWREEAHREVMRLCHLLGQDAAALNQFEVCRQLLAEELSIEPAPETKALAAEIAARSELVEPPLLPAAARLVTTPFLERPDRLPLVGRHEELAELLYQAEMAIAGNGGLVLIYGEAGVGKSRLLQTLAQNGRWRGLHTAWGRCYELVTPLPYLPLIDALRASLPVLNDSTLEPLWRAELSRLLPELAVEAGLPPSLSPNEEKHRLLEAITRAFMALAEAAPHLVLLEDVHWMDPASLEVLNYILPRLADTRLLFVGTVRPEELAVQEGEQQPAAMLAAMADTRLLRRLDLKRFDLAETGELVRRILGMTQPAPRFSVRLHLETEGNPFFLIETLWAMIEEGSLFCYEAGEWYTPWDEFTEDYTELPLPTGVIQSIERRLNRLPASLRELLDLAAVIGRGINFSLWVATSGQSEQALLFACSQLCARGLLLPVDADMSVGVNIDYIFAHDQIRRVAYQQLAPPHRRAYHDKVAQTLTKLTPHALETLADHWMRAEAWQQAAQYHQQAGDRARKIFANNEAIVHYKQALSALERLPDRPDLARQYQLHLALEAIYDLLGQRELQLASLQAMESLVEMLGSDERSAETVLRRANFAEVSGDYPAAITAVRQAIQLGQASQDKMIQAVGHWQWGGILLSLGAYTDAGDQFEQALTLARAIKASRLEADILRNKGVLANYQGDYETALDVSRHALTLCLKIGDKRGEGRIRNNLALIAWSQGDYDTAVEHLEQASHVYREVGDRRNEGSVLLNLGRVYLEQHDYSEANTYLTQALDIFVQAGDRQAEGWVQLNRGRAAFLNCEPDQAAAYCQHALHIFDNIHVPLGKALALVNLGGIHRQLGDFDQAQRCLAEALPISRGMGDRQGESWGIHYLANILADLGDYEGALAHLNHVLTLAAEIGDKRGRGWALADLSALFHYLGDNNAAYAHAEAAVVLAQALNYPLLQGVALLRLGYALSSASQQAKAAKAFQDSLSLMRRSQAKELTLSPLSGLISLALLDGDPAPAQVYAEEILDYLENNTLYGIEEPLAIYLTCYRALQANGDLRGEEILATAYDLLQIQAAKIGNEALRHSFLENVAANREIVTRYQEQRAFLEHHAISGQKDAVLEQKQVIVALPKIDGPYGRSLRDNAYVHVTWTLVAAEDEMIPGKVARRRHRILRLLREAHAQGAAPNHHHLAQALKVSQRTIERDMAYLRSQKLIPTSSNK